MRKTISLHRSYKNVLLLCNGFLGLMVSIFLNFLFRHLHYFYSDLLWRFLRIISPKQWRRGRKRIITKNNRKIKRRMNQKRREDNFLNIKYYNKILMPMFFKIEMFSLIRRKGTCHFIPPSRPLFLNCKTERMS